MRAKVTTITNEIGRRKAVLENTLRDLVRASGERDELRIEHMADPLDQVRSNTDREMAVQRLDQLARSIHDVRAALEKVEAGEYGLCEQCEEPIAARRLDAMPWARLCVGCQAKAEREGGEEGMEFDHAA